jgi:hypothetical protein
LFPRFRKISVVGSLWGFPFEKERLARFPLKFVVFYY